jgi:rhamnogalacturonyl hydrolase YesR
MNEHTHEDYLGTALKAEAWIASHASRTDHGLVWGLANEAPDKYLHTLYAGSAGIALYYLELHQATGDSRYLEIARQAGTDLVHYVHQKETLTCSALGGWAGYFFVLGELTKATGDDTFMTAARHCAQKLRDQASDIGAGIGWVAPMPYANLTGQSGEREIYDVAEGAAGAGLYYLYAHEQGIHEESLDWVRGIADRLLEVAKPAEGGLRWQLMEDIPWPFDAPNFAHGTAGVAYFMARVFQTTGDQKYLDAAIAGAGHVQAMADPIGTDAHLVPHIMNDGRPHRYYLGFCHGPAGTARLFYLLGEVNGDAAWMQWSRGLDRGLAETGAPEERGRGFWNNISQCCCDAGIGDHAVWMYRATGDEFYLDLAHRVAAELLRRSSGDADTRFWPQAEHRSQPDFIQAQTGYMQGAAGVGSFLTHLATTLEGKPVKILFPEAPYGQLA